MADSTTALLPDNFDKVGLNDNQLRALIEGYLCREIQISQDNTKRLSTDIVTICLLYTLPYDKFIHCACGRSIIKSSHNMSNNVIEYVDDHPNWDNVYGKLWINCRKYPNLIYEWTFKCDARGYTFGIDSYKQFIDDLFVFNYSEGINPSKFYSRTSNRILLSRPEDQTFAHKEAFKYTDVCCRGDIVKMIFNVKNKTLKFIFNNNDVGIAYENVDTSLNYRMVTAIHGQRHKEPGLITLSDFNIKNV